MLIVPTTFKSVSIPSFMKIYRACFKKNLISFFLVVTPFLGPFSTLPFFTHGDSYFLSFYTHTHTIFTFLHLASALVTINTANAIYLFLIHHCTNILSSLHIFVHHCTFCASLHTKTSPENISTQ